MSDYTVTDAEIGLIGPILQRLMWSDQATRAKIQHYGVNVLPINFYSNAPSLAEVEASYEYTSSEPQYLNPTVFNPAVLRDTLNQLLPYVAEFAPPSEGDETTTDRFFWQNSQFSYSDAMAYYCFVRLLQPRAILEIGSGFSTLVALEAVRRNDSGVVHCIEPFPRPFLQRNQAVVLHMQKAQALQAEFLNDTLHDGDILFIDSTHTVKTGSDCLHIYLRLLPALRRQVWVHVHDVFLPFGLPQAWLLNLQIFWTEQYLVLAFLIDNPKATVVYGSHLNALWHGGLMNQLMGGKQMVGGSSLWFKYDGSQGE
jgi:hypothetical protein